MIFDSRKQVEEDLAASLYDHIGIRASYPFPSRIKEEYLVEYEVNSIRLWMAAGGGTKPRIGIEERIKKDTERIINQIDRVIDYLQIEKVRLKQSLQQIKERED